MPEGRMCLQEAGGSGGGSFRWGLPAALEGFGWNRLRERLKPYQGPGGRWTANLLVMDCCRDFIRTVPGLIYDEHTPEDLDTSGEDHCADETRYAVMARPQATPAPPVMSREEREIKEFWDAVRRDVYLARHPPEDEETWEAINA